MNKNYIRQIRNVSFHLGLATSGPDKQLCRVEFRDWKIEVAK